MDELDNLVEKASKLPILDPRSPDEILYNEQGLPKELEQ